MKKENTLKKNWEFQKIIASKKQIVSKYLICYYQKSKSDLRVGISVSKRFANAVKRNRYKRQVRHALDLIAVWKLKFDVVVILRKEFLNLEFNEKTKELRQMFERL